MIDLIVDFLATIGDIIADKQIRDVRQEKLADFIYFHVPPLSCAPSCGTYPWQAGLRPV